MKGAHVDAVRLDICAYTASFRIPGMMGYQTTSPVPPPATVYGLLAAAAGREVTPEETWIAYRFEYVTQAQDLETIISFFDGGPSWSQKLNAVNAAPIIREFLFQPRLVLYLKPGDVAEAFLEPRYALLLGRSQDVAYVEARRAVALESVSEGHLAGALLPFPTSGVRSRLNSFPTWFPINAPRSALAVKPFHVLDFANGPQLVATSDVLFREEDDALAVPLFGPELLGP